ILSLYLSILSLCLTILSGVNSYVFYFIPDKMTWTEAQTYCRKHHTDLATVNDQTDLDELLKTLPKGFKSNIWIGLYRMNAKAPWVFSDGSSSLFRPWISGQPNNSGGYQHCVYTDPDGYWNDWQCTDPFAFICYGELLAAGTVQVKPFNLVVSV
uniref:C-type lectin domain-containing protein n=1 Tax=Sinocyclocheilus grahami TaxID=75366 RepID=A0A672NNW4_SINGR